MGELDPRIFEAAFRDVPLGMAIGTPDGQLLAVNDALCGLVGYSRAQLLASGFRLATPEPEVAGSLDAVARLVRGELPSIRIEKSYVHRAGHLLRAQVLFSLLRIQNEQPLLVVQVQDITAQHTAEQEAHLFFEQSRDMLGIYNSESGRLDRVNGAWQRILGWSNEEMLGRPLLWFVHPDDSTRSHAERDAIEGGRPAGGFRNRLRTRDGAYRWLEWTTHATGEEKQFCIARDVTEQVRREELLVHQVAMNDAIFDSMSDHLMVTDNDGKTLRVNGPLRREWGVEPEQAAPALAGRFEVFLPDRSTRFPQEQLPLAQALRGESVDQVEMWARPIGSREGRWHSVTANPILDARGRQLGAVVVSRDVTERKVLQQRMSMPVGLESTAQRVLEGLRETPLVMAAFDEQDLLRWANPAFEARFLHGLPLPVSFTDVLRHGHRGGFGVHIESKDLEGFLSGVNARRRSAPFRAFATDLVDGEWLWMTETRLRSNWLLSIASTITPLKLQERVLSDAMNEALSAAYSDALTGCPNRRALTRHAQAALAEAQRTEAALSIVAIDLDHFKQVNDRFGHGIGDAVLRHFATYCQKQLRTGDYFGRLGGEEFVAILSGTACDEARQIADDLRRSLGPLELGPQLSVAYTFSAGVTQMRSADSWEQVLIRADEALYEAKARGRNRVERR